MLNERIFSLETEYGIQFYPEDSPPPDTSEVFELIGTIKNTYGIPNSQFLVNGSKLHYDVGHPEWSLPECRTAYEATIYDKAADHLLRAAIPETEQRLAAGGYKGHLFVFKNNIDSSDNTFGCHENYLMQRDAKLLEDEAFLRYLARCLVPFLVTRQLLCGAGNVRFADRRAFYELSQRARFINAVVSQDTQYNRGIVNIGRERESLSRSEHRRVHLILGDCNLSGWATWIKLGTTGLLLRPIEDLYLNDIPLIADPVSALQTISSDMTHSESILLRDGTSVQALDIQWQYYEALCDYLEEFGMSDDEEAILEAWGTALQDLSQEDGPSRLRRRADWAIKKDFIDHELEQLGYTWDSELDDETIASLRSIDLNFHALREQGLYTQLRSVDTLISADEIEVAKSNPPPYTRANIRGRAVAGGRQGHYEVEIETWTDLSLNGNYLNLRDPLQFIHPSVTHTRLQQELETALASSDTGIMLRAVNYLGRLGGKRSLEMLVGVINNTENELVRRAAIKAVGSMQESDNFTVLVDCMKSSDVSTRWAAEEALKRLGSASDEDPWDDDESDGDDEPLVNIS